MKKLLVWIAAVMMAGGWEVTVDPHPLNTGVIMATACGAGYDYYAFNRRDLEAGETKVWFPRPTGMPEEKACWSDFYVTRRLADDSDNPADEAQVHIAHVIY